jgi:hypothetical protein
MTRRSLAIFLTLMWLAALSAQTPVRGSGGVAVAGVVQDLQWSREFVVSNLHGRKPTVTAGIDAFNVLNRVNLSYFVGDMSSPFFGQAISAQAPRRMQFSLRLRY